MTLKEMIYIDEVYKEESSDEEKVEAESGEESIIEEADSGEMLMLKRVLHAQVNPQENQWEILFHTRCTVKRKVCSMIIDNGSCQM